MKVRNVFFVFNLSKDLKQKLGIHKSTESIFSENKKNRKREHSRLSLIGGNDRGRSQRGSYVVQGPDFLNEYYYMTMVIG